VLDVDDGTILLSHTSQRNRDDSTDVLDGKKLWISFVTPESALVNGPHDPRLAFPHFCVEHFAICGRQESFWHVIGLGLVEMSRAIVRLAQTWPYSCQSARRATG
jgi:hypothetical protein